MIKYLVCPGIVISKHDGQEHYISARELISLFNVNPRECKIIDSRGSAYGIRWEDYTVLRPSTDGNYQLQK